MVGHAPPATSSRLFADGAGAWWLERVAANPVLMVGSYGYAPSGFIIEDDSAARDPGIAEIVGIDDSKIYLGPRRARIDLETRSVVQGHVPDRPDLEVLASARAPGTEATLLVASDASPLDLYLLAGDRVASAGPRSAEDRLLRAAGRLVIVGADGSVRAHDASTLEPTWQSGPIVMPDGAPVTTTFASVDEGGAWLSIETAGRHATLRLAWTPDEPSIDEIVLLARGRPARLVADDGARLWLIGPGAKGGALYSVTKADAEQGRLAARKAGRSPTCKLVRSIGKGTLYTIIAVTAPISMPIVLAVIN
jgi:hypothetical protein